MSLCVNYQINDVSIHLSNCLYYLKKKASLMTHCIILSSYANSWERSGSVVECLTLDRRAAGLSLTGITVLFVCFVALRPKSTAMVIAGRSVHLTTLFPGQA